MTFKVRLVCEAENGDGKGWHYFWLDQETLDDSANCPDHPTAETRDFVIEKEIP